MEGFKEALESQKGAQFFKSYNNSLDFKHAIAEHFYYLGSKENQDKNKEEWNIIREWFDAVQDLNPKYLKKEDYLLAEKIYKRCEARITNSILKGLEK